MTIPSTWILPQHKLHRHSRWDPALEDSMLLSASCTSSLQPLTKGLIPFCLPLGGSVAARAQLQMEQVTAEVIRSKA